METNPIPPWELTPRQCHRDCTTIRTCHPEGADNPACNPEGEATRARHPRAKPEGSLVLAAARPELFRFILTKTNVYRRDPNPAYRYAIYVFGQSVPL